MSLSFFNPLSASNIRRAINFVFHVEQPLLQIAFLSGRKTYLNFFLSALFSEKVPPKRTRLFPPPILFFVPRGTTAYKMSAPSQMSKLKKDQAKIFPSSALCFLQKAQPKKLCFF
jgi:hypothetical protein